MEEKIRVFVCVDFPSEVVKEVARVGEILGKTKFTGKLTELENLHLTLKFLGEIDSENLEKVRESLRGVRMEGFEAKLGGIGIFSYRGKPRIVWIKLNGKGIYELQKKVDSVLKGCRFALEERFMSHLTVARVKYVRDLKGFYGYVKNIKVRLLKFKVEEFKLMSSELDRIGPRYEILEEYKLKNEK